MSDEQQIERLRINTFRGQAATAGMSLGQQYDREADQLMQDVLVPDASYIPPSHIRPSWIRYHTSWDFNVLEPGIRKALKEGILIRGEEDDPIEYVVAAIGKLSPKQEELWTDEGKPLVRALEDELGKDITAADRDKAWRLHQERKAEVVD